VINYRRFGAFGIHIQGSPFFSFYPQEGGIQYAQNPFTRFRLLYTYRPIT